MPRTILTVVNRQRDEFTGWRRTGEINSVQLENGLPEDIQGAPKRSSTAIPTPFGRLHLLEAAFRFVKNNPEGNTHSHALVSQCWDLLQLLFFSRPTDAYRIDFTSWRRDEQLTALTDKGLNARSRLLGDTLGLFLQDSQFADLRTIYLIWAVNTATNERLLLGATSPLTLVFVQPDVAKLRTLQVQRRSSGGNQGFYFDAEIISLSRRPQAFQEYIYWLFIRNASLRTRCKAMYDSLNQQVYNDLENDTDKLNHLENQFKELEDTAASRVEAVTGVFLQRLADQRDTSDWFLVANPSLPQTGRPPLVLKPGHDELRTTNYFNGTSADDRTKIAWGYAQDNLEERVLETIGTKYPFLTVNDFLEEYLVELPYEADTERFYYGKVQWAGGATPEQHPFRFLLPLRKRWFTYFLPADLDQYLSFTIYPTRVVVTLSIPVGRNPRQRDRLTTYTREYTVRSASAPRLRDLQPAIAVGPGEKEDKGGKVYAELGAALFPFLRFTGEDDRSLNNLYFVQVADNAPHEPARLSFYNGTTPVEDRGAALAEPSEEPGYWRQLRTRRVEPSNSTTSSDPAKQTEALPTTVYYQIENTAFDYIQLEHAPVRPEAPAATSLLVPRWQGYAKADGTPTTLGGGREFTFGVDFGTTSTHVAYVTDQDRVPVPLRVEETDRQSVTLSKSLREITPEGEEASTKTAVAAFLAALQTVLHREFVPGLINSKGAIASFPLRTVSCEAPSFLDGGDWMLFGDINVGFYHAYDQETDQNQAIRTYKTNLKWETSGASSLGNKRLRAFFRELLMLIKHEVALNRGDVHKTRLVWSRPLSLMDEAAFNGIWLEEFSRVFASSPYEAATRIRSLSESWAPFEYLSSEYANLPGDDKRIVPSDTKNVVTVDIGGGTTDILLLEGTAPGKSPVTKAALSFQFAGDVLWGDKTTGAGQLENGFLRYYMKQVLGQRFGRQEATKAAWAVIESAASRSNTTSPVPSTEIISLLFTYDKLKFTETIAGAHNLRIVLLLHYAAIIYYIGQACKVYNLALPRYLAFSGKGSLYLRMLDPDVRLQQLTQLTRRILEFSSGAKMPETSNPYELLKLAPEPKEITAYGAALWMAENKPDPADQQEGGYFAGYRPQDGKELPKRTLLSEATSLRQGVLDNVHTFLQFMLRNEEVTDIIEKMRIQYDPVVVYDFMHQRLEDSFDAGIERLAKDLAGKSENQRKLTQPLFFLPIRDALTQLCTNLTK
ncbi:hypothetical protein [Hymenobacter sp. 102]|uniref:hypothetical protein n=1 Tax=Hymenobacter sp. 102 TaxID=3403152 RepID=UPI003CE90C7A